MSGIEELAQLFGAATTGVQNVAEGTQRVTEQTIKTEQKVMDTIDESKQGAIAYAGVTAFAQLGSFFVLLYIAGKVSKKGGER